MEIGKTIFFKNRNDWRKWLSINHDKTDEVWLITYKKHTGKKNLPYNDAVEEALCFGWIDSIVKRLDEDRTVQRYSPRKERSQLSPMNRERVRRLIAKKRMTKFGLAKIKSQLSKKFAIDKDVLKKLKKDKTVWNNFQKFSQSYKRIRVGWIQGARIRPEEFKKRLKYFLKMTKKNKKFGMVQ